MSAPVLLRLFVAASVTIRIVYLAFGPLDLSPDEAHYWDWSRHPDWCYYSKGPLVAWLIRGSCELLGNTPFAVRLPAVGCHALFLLAMSRLLAAAPCSAKQALIALALLMTIPPVAASAVLMTIDAPFLALWAWAVVFVRKALLEERERAWNAAGACVAIGVLAKLTILLLPLCVGLFLIAERRPLSRHYYRFLIISSLGLIPMLLWNATHDWLGLRHALGHAGTVEHAKVGFHWWRPFDFLGGQVAFLAGYWFLAGAAAVVAFRPWRANSTESFLSPPHLWGRGQECLSLFWYLCVPVVVLFAVVGLRTKVQPNWPAAGYVTGFLLAISWLTRQMESPSRHYRRLVRACLALGILAGLGVSLVTHFPQLGLPLFHALAAEPTDDDPAPLLKVDPTARLRGWRTLAAEIDRVRGQIRRDEGDEPLIATMVWPWPGEIGFYCAGNPRVYSFGAALSDRHSQYDVWRPNPVADAQVFAGRTFMYIGEAMPDIEKVCDRFAGPVRVVHRENGVPVNAWKIWVLHGFRGFAARPDAPGF